MDDRTVVTKMNNSDGLVHRKIKLVNTNSDSLIHSLKKENSNSLVISVCDDETIAVVGGMDDSEMTEIMLALIDFFYENSVDDGHGLAHALEVHRHLCNAIKSDKEMGIFYEHKHVKAMRLAALLHDVDDKKFFKTVDYANAKIILKNLYPGDNVLHTTVIEMIDVVSFSGNGNWKGVHTESYYYPRHADRLEAIGQIGIKRAELYSEHIGRPKFNDKTPMATTDEEIIKNATSERYLDYLKGVVRNDTLIDHFYDKLLHIAPAIMESGNSYFTKIAMVRHRELMDFLLGFKKI